MYGAAVMYRRHGVQAAADVPPHWAVVVVKICVIGILLLPITTLLCLRLLFGPTVEPDFRPLALVVGTIGLWIGMYVTAMAITTTYPPVRRDVRREREVDEQ